MTPISITALISQLFKIVDRVIETGTPVEIERKGQNLVRFAHNWNNGTME